MSKLFWLILAIACITWYSTITIYIAIKGVADIKTMLAHLGRIKAEGETSGDG